MKLSLKTIKAATTQHDLRWQAVLARDATYDGRFYYSVSTTGIYCRPSCGARRPKPEHVDFHASPQDAEQAGFKPCKRCKPNQPPLAEQQAVMVANACNMIEQADHAFSLEQLAQQAGISSFHFHRIFKAITGLTPKAYTSAHLHKRVRMGLKQSDSVTAAIFDAGYQASSRFYEYSTSVLGMTPSRFRAGGLKMQIRFAVAECSLGAILVASTTKGVCAILLGDDPESLLHELEDTFPHAELLGGDAGFEEMVAQVVGLIEAPGLGLSLPLDIQGTAFQQRVWQLLRDIPPGTTATYTEIAAKLGSPRAVRAVASACAANKLAVAIPCHRVVRRDGHLAGYRWGIARKRALLDKESGLECEDQ
ncbi:bifunctional DNA-binding transcriptional regulator/O6-methylguanine-DNA methyltransferase Ada [Methylobacillus gramineus]|uniref:bifunctional DNA-binding transcriptional regulator/O6-methylguanine-DNA methyltransferase Ada n=1 Tax=Methylobacillus gramineus TaxID=755169 RepID=UPI001CFF776B|nr:bifunctional DNA-binding transcriptional regulator/O6-methylguanine-DNA methyltransferase Ada [Methylobacillus gramineus]MCB5184214.1 bifunctional DNA-binding transcriptional regulator/O6-methylguanine-DNA methyltransferase Ada [Methylobacillus gramineus]